MSDGTDTNSQNQPGVDDITVSRAELERLKGIESSTKDIIEEAELGNMSPQEYVDYLASKAVEAAKPATTTQPASQPAATTQPASQPVQQTDNVLQTATYHAVLESHYAGYQVAQMGGKPEDKATYSRQDLQKVIDTKPNLVKEVARENGGNLFVAAQEILDLKQGKAKASQAGADAEKARQQAGNSAQLGTSAPAPASSGEEADRKELLNLLW